MEALIRAGALDGLGPSRSSMMLTLTNALLAAEQLARNTSTGQDDMFGGALAGHDAESRFETGMVWSEEERLAGEKETPRPLPDPDTPSPGSNRRSRRSRA